MERREFLRVPIDAPHFISVIFDEGESIVTLLVDISRGGLQVAFPPHQPVGEEIFLGRTVRVTELPGSVEQASGNVGGLSGTISWVSPQRCGVRFFSPLELGDEELAALVEGL